MKRFSSFLVAGLIAATIPGVGAQAATPTSKVATEPPSVGTPAGLRKLTQGQYRNIIADVFGPDIRVPGRFEPEVRRDGLLAVGSRQVSITPAGIEQYDLMARQIAAQIVDRTHRGTLLPCTPSNSARADAACTAQTIGKIGRWVFRRPLTKQELDARVALAARATEILGDYYAGLEYALANLLMAPQFLFREELTEANPNKPGTAGTTGTTGTVRLDGFAKAMRLSFLLWNTTPDDELLAAAEHGELQDQKGLERQVERLMSSPRVAGGLRAFFSDMLGFDAFDELAKDPIIYPRFSARLANDMQEQTLRTIVDHVLVQQRDYRDLFTTRKTFINRTLAALYRVPLPTSGWQPYEFAPGDPHGGWLTQPSFLVLHAHPGRTSATLRGKAVRELLLCQDVPAPPGNVDFKIVQDTSNPEYKTARARLTAHRSEPMCAGCHKVTDPIGLALENFDGDGEFRREENGVSIDPSGDLDGAAFKDAVDFGERLRNHPQIASCLVSRVYAYGIGAAPKKGDRAWLSYMTEQFAQAQYRVPELFRKIATSEALYRVEQSSPATAVTVADPAANVRNTSDRTPVRGTSP